MSLRRRPYNLATALGLEHLIRLHLLIFGLGIFMLGASLQWEPHEWRQPVFGILFAWMTAQEWAVVCAVIAGIKLASFGLYPRLVPFALVLGNVLFVAWTVSFVFAYLDERVSPATPLLPMLCFFIVGEHLAVASLLQREKAIKQVDDENGES